MFPGCREHLQVLKEERQRLEKEQKRQHDRLVQRERNERNERDWERLKRSQRARAKEEAEGGKKHSSRAGSGTTAVTSVVSLSGPSLSEVTRKFKVIFLFFRNGSVTTGSRAEWSSRAESVATSRTQHACRTGRKTTSR